MALDSTQCRQVDLSHAQHASLCACTVCPDTGEQRHTIDDVLGFQQVPTGQGDLCARTNGDSVDVLRLDLGLLSLVRGWRAQTVEGAEHVLVREVITQAQHELDLVTAGFVGRDGAAGDVAHVVVIL